jgi:phospholipid/cholesterol/gamma-HCH transport system substrate-binding protein
LDSRTTRQRSIRQPLADESGFTAPRLIALAALIAAVAVVAVTMLADRESYKVKATFQNAGQLVPGNEVRVGGRPIGTITDVELDQNAQAVVSMEIDEELAPLHEGTTATIRAPSLSGIANRYVSLHPGPNNTSEISDGGSIGADETSAPVDLDQLFNAFNPETRRALQQVVQGSATWYAGKSRQASESLLYLPAALSTTSAVTREVALDDKVFERFVVDTTSVVSALAERRDDLAALVGNAGATARAIGADSSLDRALALLPSTLRKGNTAFVNLRATLDDLDVLVDESKPATRDLPRFLRELRPLVADARPTIRDLRTAVRTRGADNDLIELTTKMPRLQRLTGRVFPRAIRALDRAQPVIAYARPYTTELVGWIKNYGQSAASYDANGHFAKISPLLGGFHFDGTELVPQPVHRLNDVAKRQERRCPGSAAPRSPDGSTPFAVEDCDPSVVPPGS